LIEETLEAVKATLEDIKVSKFIIEAEEKIRVEVRRRVEELIEKKKSSSAYRAKAY